MTVHPSIEGQRVLRAVREARLSGTLAPHAYSILQHVPPTAGMYGPIPMSYSRCRVALLELASLGLIERQGRSLDFALLEAGEAWLAESEART